MALQTDLTVDVKGAITKAFGSLTGSLSPKINRVLALASGVGINQADQLYYSRPTIAGSATLTLDVATGGGLVNVYGDAIALVRLKLIIIASDLALCPNVVTLQRPAANGVPLFGAASGSLPVRPGGIVLWAAPDATGVLVTAATGDLIDLVNTAAGNVLPDVFIVGASA